MHYCKDDKESLQNNQEIVRDFTGYIKNVVYRSEEYHKIMTLKVLYSFKGFKSHPLYFDLMIKNEEAYYIGENRGAIPLNISLGCVRV
jgi:hypothetical protein